MIDLNNIQLGTKVSINLLSEAITEIRDGLIDERNRLLREYPHIHPTQDVRIGWTGKFQNVLTSFQIGCAFWALDLNSPEWWKQHTSYPENEWPGIRSEFQVFLKLGLVHLSFSAIESSLRVIMRAIDPSAHAGATVEFKRIYDDLLLRRLTPPRVEYIELLDFASKLRNTIHNNGVYFNRSGNDASQIYKGRVYNFRIGQQVETGGWPLIVEIIRDLAEMMKVIVDQPVIMSLPDPVTDPGA